MARRGSYERLTKLKTFLTILGYLASLFSLIGISILGILARLAQYVTDPWQISTAVLSGALISLAFFAVRGVVSRKLVRAELGEEFTGREVIGQAERDLIESSSHAISYIAGDFSHVNQIHDYLSNAYNRGVTIRVLVASSNARKVLSNYNAAISANCVVRTYDPNASRQVKLVVVDPGQPATDGMVMFVKKSHRGNSGERATGHPGSDRTHEYVATMYRDPLVVQAASQMFESMWEMATPYTESP